MNKKLFFLPAGMMLMAGLAQAQQDTFTIQGKADGKTNEYIYLVYMDEEAGKYVNDSAMVKDGTFSFSGKLNGVTQASVIMDRNAGRGKEKYMSAFLSPGNMQLTINYDNFGESLLTGSPAQDEMNKLNQMRAAIIAQMKPFNEAYNKANAIYSAALKEGKDEATLNTLKDAAETAKNASNPLRAQMDRINEEFMNTYPSGFATASLLRFAVSRMPWQEGMARYEKLSDEVKKSSLGKDILKEVKELKMGSPGSMATNFTSTELRGDKLSLSDYKGKYVLVDFWASWCVPCRKGNPHLLSLYAKYKNKGFEIIGISDDDSKPEAWKKAVEQDKIGVWKHVLRGLKSDGKGNFDRTNDISDNYGISSLPTKILIDPNGKIIGRYGGGGENDAAMDKKLAEVFGSK